MITLQKLIVLFRTLYLISRNSEKHEVVIDEDTLKCILDELKKLDGNNKKQTWCLVLCAEIAKAKRQDLMNRSIRFAM